MGNISNYYVILTAYNEEKVIESSFSAVKKAIDYSFKNNLTLSMVNIIFCPNGCTDGTPQIIEELKRKYSNEKIKIEVISSPKGMVIAQNASIRFIRNIGDTNSPIFFIDTDSLIDEKVIDILIKQLERHPSLKAIGTCPIPLSYNGKSIARKFMDRVLNCRAYFPKSEITVRYAPEFHPYAETDPQEIGAEFEKYSKIYFHGRCFVLRNEAVWDVPENTVGEDTYLDRSIHFRFGRGSIRTMYDAKIYFYPMSTLGEFSKTFYRVYCDLRNLKHIHPERNDVREYSKTKLDWNYIRTLPIKWQFFFMTYSVVRKYYHFLFKHNLAYSGKSALDVWSYEQKTH